MFKWMENYRFEGEMHRQAIEDLPHREALSVDEKE
jgi:hypothetical protein